MCGPFLEQRLLFYETIMLPVSTQSVVGQHMAVCIPPPTGAGLVGVLRGMTCPLVDGVQGSAESSPVRWEVHGGRAGVSFLIMGVSGVAGTLP